MVNEGVPPLPYPLWQTHGAALAHQQQKFNAHTTPTVLLIVLSRQKCCVVSRPKSGMCLACATVFVQYRKKNHHEKNGFVLTARPVAVSVDRSIYSRKTGTQPDTSVSINLVQHLVSASPVSRRGCRVTHGEWPYLKFSTTLKILHVGFNHVTPSMHHDNKKQTQVIWSKYLNKSFMRVTPAAERRASRYKPLSEDNSFSVHKFRLSSRVEISHVCTTLICKISPNHAEGKNARKPKLRDTHYPKVKISKSCST